MSALWLSIRKNRVRSMEHNQMTQEGQSAWG